MAEMNIKEINNRFSTLLDHEDRGAAVTYASEILANNAISIPDLYEMILAPLLNLYPFPNDATRIAREHVRSGIIRSIIENVFPYVLKAQSQSEYHRLNKKVLVTCPTEEYHEIGARMAVDFFELAGFHAVFTGSNTPGPDILAAIAYQKPDYVALSVSNFYNLVKAKDIIEQIHTVYPNLLVLIGGAVFSEEAHRDVVPNTRYINSYQSVVAFAQEAKHALT